MTVRIIFALAAAKGWIQHHLDINNAFLNGFLDEDIYMALLEGYKEEENGKVSAWDVFDIRDISANVVETPLRHDWFAQNKDSPLLTDSSVYKRLVGRLLYLNFTRPDLILRVHYLSRFMQHPTNSLVSWKSKKQSTVARSSSEAEYRSAATCVCELKWISYIMEDLQYHDPLPIFLHCDNKSAIQLIENPVFHERTKYIELDCHIIRDHYKLGFMKPVFIPSEQQLADPFINALPAPIFEPILSKMSFLAAPS
ncbi:hypothetical protein LIER_11765 [Lithospermum erythrorhizon]|uniref:Reverse transcriptase Ty1/copia-type domain-containing protein n=1 Tax=Lithospermum erythrorhizon TaxID=34254 RepID=A0AAV3PQV6_LITER